MNRVYFLLVMFALLVLMKTPVVLAVKHRSSPQLMIYDKAVNETLDVCLEVGSEWRTEKRRFTWNELQLEVARRLRV